MELTYTFKSFNYVKENKKRKINFLQLRKILAHL